MSTKYDVFISYNWKLKKEVKQLESKLKTLGWRVWRDERKLQSNHSPLTSLTALSLRRSAVFLCCITSKYCESNHCSLEIEFASALKKPMVALMNEKINAGGFFINQIDCFETKNWIELKFEEITQSIQKSLNILQENFISDGILVQGRYQQVYKLGEGSMSIVYKVIDTADNNKIKTLKRMKESVFKIGDNKTEQLLKLDDENLIKYFDLIVESFNDDICYIITEYFVDGTLNEAIAEKKATAKSIEYQLVITWSKQILNGLAYLHERDPAIVHRDIKPCNIFLNRNSLVIGDISYSTKNAIIKGKSNETRSKKFGTDNYWAPEILIDQKYDTKVDIWAFGCILFEMVKLRKLFIGKTIWETGDLIKKFNNNDLQLENLKPLFCKIIFNCVIKEPEKRLTARELIKIFEENIDDLTDYSPILSTRISSPNSAFSFSRYVATLPSPSLTILELNKAPSLLKELTLKKEEEERKEKELKLKQTNDFLIQKGLSFAATNKHYQAIDLFEKAISNDSNYCPALYFKADSLYQLLNYNESLLYLNKVIELNPDYPNVYFLKGMVLFNLEKYKEAVENYSKSIEMNPNDENSYNAKGNALFKLGKYEFAIQMYDKSIELNGSDLDAYNLKAKCLNALHKYEESIECFNKAFSIDPNYKYAHVSNGNALYNNNDYEDAIEQYNKAISYNPHYSTAYLNKADALLHLNKVYQALNSYNKAIKFNHQNETAFKNKADLLFQLERHEEALFCYDRAIQINPNYLEAFNNKGDVLDYLNREREALVCYTKAIELNSKPNLIAYINKAKILYKLEKYDETIQDLKKIIENFPNSESVYSLMGDAYNKMKQFSEAIYFYEKALAINPRLEEIEMKTQTLKKLL